MSWLDDAENKRIQSDLKQNELIDSITNGRIAEKQELRDMLHDIGEKTGWSQTGAIKQESVSRKEWKYQYDLTEHGSTPPSTTRVLSLMVGLEISAEFQIQPYFSYAFRAPGGIQSQGKPIKAETISELKSMVADMWLALHKDFELVRRWRS